MPDLPIALMVLQALADQTLRRPQLAREIEHPSEHGRAPGTKEFKEGGGEVRLIFDGAATKWVGELAKPDHRYHQLFEAVRDRVAGACGYCAHAYGAEQDVHREEIALLDEYEHHPSLRRLVAEGFQVLTF